MEAEPVEDLVYGTPPPDEAYQTYDAEHDDACEDTSASIWTQLVISR